MQQPLPQNYVREEKKEKTTTPPKLCERRKKGETSPGRYGKKSYENSPKKTSI